MVQGGSNMTGIDCGLFTHKSVPVIFEPPCIYCPFFSLQNAVCFIILTYLVPVLFTFYTQGLLKLNNNSGAKRLTWARRKMYCAFVIVCNKWRIFAIDICPDFCNVVVNTCCILHNFVRQRDGLQFQVTV